MRLPSKSSNMGPMLTLITLLGCSQDLDSDGYDDSSDCDDNNASVYPGALESCNGIDDNCDGMGDDGAHDALYWFADTDGDGCISFDEFVSAVRAGDSSMPATPRTPGAVLPLRVRQLSR